MSEMSNPVVKKPRKGRFQPGVSGNPDGRPKGARNKITLLRQSLELQLREQSKNFLPGVLEQAIQLALQGDRQMIKLLLDLHMSKGVADEQQAQEKTQIIIGSVKDVEVRAIPAQPVEAPSVEEPTQVGAKLYE